MTDILSRLTAALAERYEIKHELGAGVNIPTGKPAARPTDCR